MARYLRHIFAGIGPRRSEYAYKHFVKPGNLSEPQTETGSLCYSSVPKADNRIQHLEAAFSADSDYANCSTLA